MRVEYADELLIRLHPDSARIETAGFLCGSRDASAVRLVSTSQKGAPADVVAFISCENDAKFSSRKPTPPYSAGAMSRSGL